MSIDLHTHSRYSDGASTLEENLATAVARGVTVFGASDHVRRATSWVPEYAQHVARIAAAAPIEVRCGVEAKILDSSGRLDLPADLDGVDYIAVADHRMPLNTSSAHPQDVARAMQLGVMDRDQILETLITATVAAARTAPRPVVIAHLFSLLPKMGLCESQVPEDLLEHLASGLSRADALVELNEKWRCPAPRTVELLERAGVVIVTGSDAHRADQVGVFDWAYRQRKLPAPA